MKVFDTMGDEWGELWGEHFPLVPPPEFDPEAGLRGVFEKILGGAHRQKREEINIRTRERYHSDEAFRRRTLEKGKEWKERKRGIKKQ